MRKKFLPSIEIEMDSRKKGDRGGRQGETNQIAPLSQRSNNDASFDSFSSFSELKTFLGASRRDYDLAPGD